MVNYNPETVSAGCDECEAVTVCEAGLLVDADKPAALGAAMAVRCLVLCREVLAR
jgi:hypothetical protein